MQKRLEVLKMSSCMANNWGTALLYIFFEATKSILFSYRISVFFIST